MITPRTTTASADVTAPLSPNAWLRYDLINRMLPVGITDVLEIGCGQGSLGVRLARRYHYLGVEPDPTSYAVARQRLSGFGEVRNAFVVDLPSAERFDLVCAFEVLEHLADDTAALAEWSARLRPDGWLLLSVPAYQHRFGPADELVGHFRRYDPTAMVALLGRCGFGEIDLRQYGMPLGYLLEAGRNRVGRRRLGSNSATMTQPSMAERTAGSGRLWQPGRGLAGAVTRWGTVPFRMLQRAFPNAGTGIVVRARLLGG